MTNRASESVHALPLFASASGDSCALDVPLRASRPGLRERREELYGGSAPAVAGSPTSVATAKRIEPKRLSWREKVFLYIESRGTIGATRKEIAVALAISENTVRPRVCELVAMNRVQEAPHGATRDECAILLTSEHARGWSMVTHPEARSVSV